MNKVRQPVTSNPRSLLAVATLVAVLCSSCAIIAGTETEDQQSASALSIRFVESLRSEKSLQGERWKEPQFGTSPATSLQQPNSVYADAFRVYVTDTYTSTAIPAPRIFVFDRNKQTLTILPTPPSSAEGRLLGPTSIVADSSNGIFVADTPQGKVFGYDRNGKLMMTLGLRGDIGVPTGLAFDRRRELLCVADSASRDVKMFTTFGSQVASLEHAEDPKQGFHAPTSITLDKAGYLYVLDGHRRVVSVYDPDRKFTRRFVLTGESPGSPARPKGIAIDSDGHVYIPDMLSNSVFVYDNNGMFLATWGKTGSLAGDFWSPMGIFIDTDDLIYIADQMNSRVQVFQYNRSPSAIAP